MGPLDTTHFILSLRGTAFLPIVDHWHRPLFDKVCPTWRGREGWEYNSVWNEHYTLGAGPTAASVHGAQADLVPASWSACFLASEGENNTGIYLSYLQVGFI